MGFGKNYGKGMSGAAKGKGPRYRASDRRWSKDWKAQKYAGRVPWRQRLATSSLRPFVGDTGSPFAKPPGSGSDVNYLSVSSVTERLDMTTSEYCWRVGFALSEGGASIAAGAETLTRFHKDSLGTDERVHAAEDHGLSAVAATLNSTAGRDFVAAAKYFDQSTATERTAATTLEHVTKWHRFLTSDVEEKIEAFSKVAAFCATAYLASMEVIEAAAAMNNPQLMVEGACVMPQYYDIGPNTTEWLDDCRNVPLLLKAMGEMYHTQKVRRCDTSEDVAAERNLPAVGGDAHDDTSNEDESDVQSAGGELPLASAPVAAPATRRRKCSASVSGQPAKKKKTNRDNSMEAEEEKPQEGNPSEEVARIAPGSAWTVEEADGLMKLARTALANLESKNERLTLAELKAAVATIPERALQLGELSGLPARLAKLKRLPAKTRAREIYAALAALGEKMRALALPCAAGEQQDPEEKHNQ